MAYRVLIFDEVNGIELDTDSVDMQSVFAVADVKDIARREDAFKSVTFKGTKTNHEAFGNMFHANKTTSTSITNQILFNYNPLIKVPAFVFEDSMLVFKGSLRVIDFGFLGNEVTEYHTVITGGFIEFRTALQDKYLHELDFSDLAHEFKKTTIINSQSTSTQRTNAGVLYSEPFALGSGYVYPFIDYGHQFEFPPANATVTNWNVMNYRPAVYLKEYLKKIFSQDELPGFSYEVKGSDDFIERFNSLIIPTSDERLRYNLSGWNLEYALTSPPNNATGHTITNVNGAKLMSFQNNPAPPAGTIANFITKQSDLILNFNRTVTLDAAAHVKFTSITNGHPQHINFWIQVVGKPIIDSNSNPLHAWDVIADKKIVLNPYQVINSGTQLTFDVAIGEKEYKQYSSLAVRTYYDSGGANIMVGPFPTGPTLVTYTITECTLSLPKDDLTPFKADVVYNNTVPDIIAPKAPENIKQLDFLKSMLLLFNLYAYTETTNPKKIIFQKYDDYYALATPAYLRSSALDWSRKLDYKAKGKVTSNVSIPKSYLFAYKEDSDFLNSYYKGKYGDIFGTFRFSDAYGVTEEKKVTLIFSPTPVATYPNTNREYPLFHKDSFMERKPMKTNIRILHYNGLKDCTEYTVLKDHYSNGWTTQVVDTYSTYPNCSTYYYDGSLPTDDLNFGLSYEYFNNPSENHLNANKAYHSYYSNQVTELTNPNIWFMECQMLLNELDIANLDLRTPVFIDCGGAGHAYYKVLSIDYENNNTTSKVVLQKIYLGSEY